MSEMTQEREGAILEAAIYKFGRIPQVIVTIEEMAEFTKALTKWLRNLESGQCDASQITASIHEEMADVGIMLNQLALIFGDPTEYEIEKLERLEQLVNHHKQQEAGEWL